MNAFNESEAAFICKAKDNLTHAQEIWETIQRTSLLPACRRAMIESLNLKDSDIVSAKTEYVDLIGLYQGILYTKDHCFQFVFKIKRSGAIIPFLDVDYDI